MVAVQGWYFFGRDWLAEIAKKRDESNNWRFVTYRKRNYDPLTNFFTETFWPNDRKRSLDYKSDCRRENSWWDILKYMMNINKWNFSKRKRFFCWQYYIKEVLRIFWSTFSMTKPLNLIHFCSKLELRTERNR